MCKVHAVPALANSRPTGISNAPVYYSRTDRCHDVILGTVEDTLANELLFIFLDLFCDRITAGSSLHKL